MCPELAPLARIKSSSMKRTSREFLSILRQRQRGRERRRQSGRELARVQLEKLSRCLNFSRLQVPFVADNRWQLRAATPAAQSVVGQQKFIQLLPCEISTILGTGNEARLIELAFCPGYTPCSLLPAPQTGRRVCPCLATTTQIVGVGDTACERERAMR